MDGTEDNQLRVEGETPSTYEILTKEGVVAALWDIIEDHQAGKSEEETSQ